VYWDQLTLRAGTCPMVELRKVGQLMASSFRTALYYIEETSKEG